MFLEDIAHLNLFSLIAMRMTGFVLLNPLLSRKNIPRDVKAGMILVFTLIVYSFSEGKSIEVESSLIYGFLLLKEFAVGFVFGYVMELFFFTVTYAGSILDFQMGLSMAQVYDPQSNAQIAVSGSLYQIFYTLLFFAVDGHLVLIKLFLTSGEIIPYGEAVFTQGLALAVLDIFVECIVLAVKFTFPILAVEFLTEIAVGILMKIVPQVNIFVINIQFKIAIGFIMLVFLVSPMKAFLENLLNNMLETLGQVLTLMR